jgi:hypothetical protein
MDYYDGKSGENSATPEGTPAKDSGVHAQVTRVFADTMPTPNVTSMEGVPVELDSKVAAIRPSWWDRIWARALGTAIIPEAPGGKVEL